MNDTQLLIAGITQWIVGATRCEGMAWSNRNRQGRKEDKAKEETESKTTKMQIWKVQQLLN